MRDTRRIATAGTIACLLPTGLLVAGCGGGERQDADEPSGSFSVEVAKATFPARQSLSSPATLSIAVRNTDTKPLPNVAVTVDSFSAASKDTGLSDPQQPVWIVDQGPKGGETAYVGTWALGRLAPGATRTFTWKVTAIKSGSRTVNYRVSPGLNGKAKAADGAKVSGSFMVDISDKPVQARVDPDTGAVIRDSAGSAP